VAVGWVERFFGSSPMNQLYRGQVACDLGQFDLIVGTTLWLIIANAASSDAPPCRIAPPAFPAY
jgi:hypothetical protein